MKTKIVRALDDYQCMRNGCKRIGRPESPRTIKCYYRLNRNHPRSCHPVTAQDVANDPTARPMFMLCNKVCACLYLRYLA